jgi:hypothetical protein
LKRRRTMKDPREEILRFVPEDTEDADEELIERFMTRVNHPMRGVRPAKPRRRQPNAGRWPFPAESRALQQHHDRVDQIDYIGEQNEYILQTGLNLEYVAFKDGTATIVAEVDVLKSLPSGSLPRAFAEVQLLDGLDRIRNLSADVTEDFRAKLLG